MCSQVLGGSAVLSGLLMVCSFRPWGAGCCAAAVDTPMAVPASVSAAPTNSRRLRNTRLSVISELGILSMERHLRVQPYLHSSSVFQRRSESPLRKITDGALVELRVEGLKNSDDPRRAIFEQHDVEHHGPADGGLPFPQTEHADDARRRD